MTYTAQSLFDLLPAVHRIRDARLAQEAGLERGPLQELLALFAREIAVMGESLDQMQDDLFIETCADWLVPYIGDLIGYEALHSVALEVASARAEVAHTIALRRRKGTALVLEQLARDVTGWDARAVEYFLRLGWTQNMNHVRPEAVQSPDMRQALALERIGTGFETAQRSVDVRRPETRAGRHNIPNIGLHLWRVRSCPHRASPAIRAAERLYRASPLGHDMPLFNRPVAEEEISQPAGPDNVPMALTRRRLSRHLDRHYGLRPTAGVDINNPLPALVLSVDGTVIERDRIRICHLGDDGAIWAHTPPSDGFYAIDPTLGRIALPGDAPDPANVRLDRQEGFAFDLGGGEYERGQALPAPPETATVLRVPDDHASIAAALAALGGDGVIEIMDSSRYTDPLAIDVAADGHIEIRARNGRRPVLDLAGLTVRGGADAACTLNGLLIAGAPVEVLDDGSNALARLALIHVTLVPGITLDADGLPEQADAPSLSVETGADVTIERSILGGVRCDPTATFDISDTILDATEPTGVAFAALDDASPGAALTLVASTVIGKVHAVELPLVSNAMLLSALGPGDAWQVPVRAERKQTGCVRFSWLPPPSIVPRRYRCLPASDAPGVAPVHASRRYGTPAYGLLSVSTPRAVLTGADDGSEMGVTHHLFATQRETNLRIRLREYLGVGLHAGIFLES